MAGGGGGGYSGMSSELWEKLDAAREEGRAALNSQIEGYLGEILVAANERDTDLVGNRLTKIADILSETADVEQLLYGGSVGKRTAVEGISDVDALVIIDSETAMPRSPARFLTDFAKELYVKLDHAEVESVTAGTLAVTVKYRDGPDIQLLPAVRKGDRVMIAKADRRGWRPTAPKAFRDALTSANQKANGQLVRVVKLFKVINDKLPPQKQLIGYHIEALAIEAVKGYGGPFTPRKLLLRFLEKSSERVLTRIPDATKQSRFVDGYLHRDRSPERRNVAQTLMGLKRRLDAATSVAEWKALFDD